MYAILIDIALCRIDYMFKKYIYYMKHYTLHILCQMSYIIYFILYKINSIYIIYYCALYTYYEFSIIYCVNNLFCVLCTNKNISYIVYCVYYILMYWILNIIFYYFTIYSIIYHISFIIYNLFGWLLAHISRPDFSTRPSHQFMLPPESVAKWWKAKKGERNSDS